MKKVKLNNECYAEIIGREKIKVGCQEFDVAALRKLLAEADSMPAIPQSYQDMIELVKRIGNVGCETTVIEHEYSGEIYKLLLVTMPYYNPDWSRKIIGAAYEVMSYSPKFHLLMGHYIPLPKEDANNRYLYFYDDEFHYE